MLCVCWGVSNNTRYNGKSQQCVCVCVRVFYGHTLGVIMTFACILNNKHY